MLEELQAEVKQLREEMDLITSLPWPRWRVTYFDEAAIDPYTGAIRPCFQQKDFRNICEMLPFLRELRKSKLQQVPAISPITSG